MVEEVKWTVEAVREWAKDLFASRDEASQIARAETRDAYLTLQREGDREIRRLDEKIAREVKIRDQRLVELDNEMQRRLSEERAFRDEVVAQALTRETYEREHRNLQTKLDIAFDQLDKRMTRTEALLANLQGRAVVFAVIGSIFLATATAVITHLVSSS